MMKNENQQNAFKISRLIQSHISGTLDEHGRRQLSDWLRADEANPELLEDIMAEAGLKQYMSDLESVDTRAALARLKSKQARSRKFPFKKLLRMAAAAVVLLSIGWGWLYLRSPLYRDSEQVSSKYGDDALPGGDKATLVLADGRAVELSSKQKGIIVSDELTYPDGSLILNPGIGGKQGSQTAVSATGETVSQYVLSTPKGGQYQIILADGSKIMLNAASILRYPGKFDGQERSVELEGEGYFEISKDDKRPFIVRSKGQSVTVLGTEFNIKAYADEPQITTTLVRGSVNVQEHRTGTIHLLSPNYQTVLKDGTLEKREADVEEHTAWKDGYFRFNGAPMEEVLRQLERWYDIQVEYGDIPDRKLYARITRERKLSSVLNAIEKTSDMTFKFSERRLQVQK